MQKKQVIVTFTVYQDLESVTELINSYEPNLATRYTMKYVNTARVIIISVDNNFCSREQPVIFIKTNASDVAQIFINNHDKKINEALQQIVKKNAKRHF